MKCPHCNTGLLMTHRNNIEIDYCPDCRGIWLDRGELDKLLAHADKHLPQYYGAQHQSRSGDSHDSKSYQSYKKKRSFLGDFFDFD